MDSVEAGWYNSGTQTYDPSTRCALMLVAPARDWNVFQQIFAEHWDGFKHAHPRYQMAYYDGLVAKMLSVWQIPTRWVYRSTAVCTAARAPIGWR